MAGRITAAELVARKFDAWAKTLRAGREPWEPEAQLADEGAATIRALESDLAETQRKLAEAEKRAVPEGVLLQLIVQTMDKDGQTTGMVSVWSRAELHGRHSWKAQVTTYPADVSTLGERCQTWQDAIASAEAARAEAAGETPQE